jgi:DNA repair protein RadC
LNTGPTEHRRGTDPDVGTSAVQTAPGKSIRHWPEGDRPREKLLRHGPCALTDAELLSLIIRVGTGSQTAVDLARAILAAVADLHSLSCRTAPELMRTKGIGPAKAVELLATFELARRLQSSDGPEKFVIRSPEDVARRFGPLMASRRTEAFVVLVLHSDNSLKTHIELTNGTLNASLVHPRDVYKAAIDQGAASIIVVHNHPSGNPEPSREDIDITRQLAEAGKIVGIPLHDHVIVAGKGYTSLAERGVL